MPVTLFGFGFSPKTSATTGAELDAARQARQAAEQADAEELKQAAEKRAAATLAAELGMGTKQTKQYKDTPDARRKRRERAATQRRTQAAREEKKREKAAKDAAKAAACPSEVESETHYLDERGRKRKRKVLRSCTVGSQLR